RGVGSRAAAATRPPAETDRSGAALLSGAPAGRGGLLVSSVQDGGRGPGVALLRGPASAFCVPGVRHFVLERGGIGDPTYISAARRRVCVRARVCDVGIYVALAADLARGSL